MNDLEARAAIADALAGIAPEIELSAADPSRPLSSELDLDSMDMLSLVTDLAARTGIDLTDSGIGPEWTLDDVIAHLAAD